MNAKSQKKRAAATKSISLFKQAIAFHQVGDLKNAALTYQQILINKPENADALNLLGVVYSQLGNYEYGVKLITRAISINPGISAYFNNLANVYRKKGEPEAAVHAYQQALKLDQNNIYAHNGLGVIRYEQNRLDDAILSYRNALEINPKYVESLDNLGLALHKMEAFEEAVENFQRAIQNDPNYAQAHSNLAISLRAIGKPEESIRSFERALEINPDDEYSVINLFRELQAICDWDKIKKLTPGLDKITDKNLARREKTVETPFMSISRKMDPEENLKIARSRSSDISKRALSTSEPFDFRSRTLKNKKIRLGYLSNNFNNHPVAHQIQNLFRLHDRKRFDVFTYSYGKDDGSEYRKNIMLNADKFIDIRGYEDAEAAKQVYNDNIDILIDLVVFTEGGRLNICAMRPSPIQVNYFGFSGTSGADFFDYIIVDRVLVPESHRPFFSEKPVYVPHSFIVTNCSQKISEKIFKRADFSLPENAVVFCSFNNMYKIEPVMFDSWMNMLKKV
ncbi:MAG: tetratricopeptide repeat protein, partial [Planctomycetes bacterium]|nr:tetratricopeptide repeat protein [Planctomycetota bacterium]